jgi:hypothetical protein
VYVGTPNIRLSSSDAQHRCPAWASEELNLIFGVPTYFYYVEELHREGFLKADLM